MLMTSRILIQLIWRNSFCVLYRFLDLFLIVFSQFITDLSLLFAFQFLQISMTFIYLYIFPDGKAK